MHWYSGTYHSYRPVPGQMDHRGFFIWARDLGPIELMKYWLIVGFWLGVFVPHNQVNLEVSIGPGL